VRPHAGTAPMRECVSANRASSLAMRKSQASANSRPPVTVTPLMAPITGTGNARSTSSTLGGISSPEPNSCRSMPAQNARPAPVSTTARSPGSAASPSTADPSRPSSAAFNALSLAGRFSVTSATPAAGRSNRTRSSVTRQN
jgi:hypothetical protein